MTVPRRVADLNVVWVTNDLPPRAGGIERFVGSLLDGVRPASTVVVGPGGAREHAAHDALLDYRVVRTGGRVLPTRRIRELVVALARRSRADVVVLGAAWPLGELAPELRRRLGVPVVALTHGLEAGLAGVGLGRLVGRATRGLTVATTISDFTAVQLDGHVACPVRRLPPGVDVGRFHPGVDGTALRRQWGVPTEAPVVGCVSRLVPRKGQDVLLASWPAVRQRHPDAWLVIVGDGPAGPSLRRRARALGDRQVVMAGEVGHERLPEAYAALDLFVMPCRTRHAGIDVEGLGIVYLEAQASGVPAIAGRSGGAPETVEVGVTGAVVDGRDPAAIAVQVADWLDDPARVRDAGRAARVRAESRWAWETVFAEFAALLEEVTATR